MREKEKEKLPAEESENEDGNANANANEGERLSPSLWPELASEREIKNNKRAAE